MNQSTKLIVRSLLPLIIGGVGFIIFRTGDSLLNVYPTLDGAALRANAFITPIFQLIFPLLLLLHGGICSINRKYKFNVHYLAFILGITFVASVTIGMFYFNSLSIWGYVKLLVIEILIWVYIHILNYTRTIQMYTPESAAGKTCIIICAILIISNIIGGLMRYFQTVDTLTFLPYGHIAMAYGWFGCIWIARNNLIKGMLLVLAVVSFIFTMNLYLA